MAKTNQNELLNSKLLNQIAPLELKARKILEGFISGLHKSPYYGFSVEFAEHRPYNHGDEIRHIDWKVYGKSERYYIKQYEEETNLRCHILLDVSSSMLFKYYADWSKLKYAIHMAASLAYLMHRQRDGVGLIPFDTRPITTIPPKSSYSHLRYMFKQLEQYLAEEQTKAPDQRKTASAEVIHEIAERINRRSLVIILSDLFENTSRQDELASALKHLKHRKHEVILFHLLEKRSERELDLPDRRYIFQDLETGSEIDVLPRQVKQDYKEKMNTYVEEFKHMCGNAKIDFHQIDTESSFEHSLIAYLNKRRRLM